MPKVPAEPKANLETVFTAPRLRDISCKRVNKQMYKVLGVCIQITTSVYREHQGLTVESQLDHYDRVTNKRRCQPRNVQRGGGRTPDLCEREFQNQLHELSEC